MNLTLSAFGRELRITDKLRDHILITIWMLLTFKEYSWSKFALYPLAFYFLWAFIRDFSYLLPIVARSLVLWLFPIWWFLQLSWGDATGLIIKTGLQQILTVVICYCVIVRLSPRDIMVSVMIATGYFAVMSFLNDPAGRYPWGIFASKNYFGTVMTILWMTSLCTLLDDSLPRWVRFISAGFVVLSMRLILVADSATAVLLAGASALIILSLHFRRQLSGRMLLITSLIFCGLVFIGMAIAATIMHEIDPINQVLAAFGKDATLTGRTLLWDYAKQEIAKNPLLGLGHAGFWNPQDGLSLARKIYNHFHIKPHGHFSFHSSYYEIAVHQGLIGLGIVVCATIWCLSRISIATLMSQKTSVTFLFCVAMVTFVRSFTEIGLMSPFALMSMLMMIGALFSLKPNTRVVVTSERSAPPKIHGIAAPQ